MRSFLFVIYSSLFNTEMVRGSIGFINSFVIYNGSRHLVGLRPVPKSGKPPTRFNIYIE